MDDPTTSGPPEGFGLMFYCEASLWDNARWYDPAIGRFTQADSIVPPGVQGLDRYAYVNNNPLQYTDPTGHTPIISTDGGLTILIGITILAIAYILYDAATTGGESQRDYLLVTAIPDPTEIPPTWDQVMFPPVLKSDPTSTSTPAPAGTLDLEGIINPPPTLECPSHTFPCIPQTQTPTTLPTNTPANTPTNKPIYVPKNKPTNIPNNPFRLPKRSLPKLIPI